MLIAHANKTPVMQAFGAGYTYTFVRGNTGIAVSEERRLIKLKEGEKEKEYPLNMIRSWESNLQAGGMAVGGGIAIAAQNIKTGRDNKRVSGFFVYTKDIDNVTWRIAMLDRREQAKWMEILQQAVNGS